MVLHRFWAIWFSRPSLLTTVSGAVHTLILLSPGEGNIGEIFFFFLLLFLCWFFGKFLLNLKKRRLSRKWSKMKYISSTGLGLGLMFGWNTYYNFTINIPLPTYLLSFWASHKIETYTFDRSCKQSGLDLYAYLILIFLRDVPVSTGSDWSSSGTTPPLPPARREKEHKADHKFSSSPVNYFLFIQKIYFASTIHSYKVILSLSYVLYNIEPRNRHRNIENIAIFPPDNLWRYDLNRRRNLLQS